MIAFSHPVMLWGLLAVPAPILFHLFFRRRKARIAFSTLQFFLRRQRHLAVRRRLRERLLLLLRTLALACLALALAGMQVRHASFSMATRTSAALIVDDTLSMDRRLASGATAFEYAVHKAEEILATLREGDRAALIFLSGQPGCGSTGRQTALRQRLETARVTGARAPVAKAFDQALRELAVERHPNRELFFLSDFQANQAPPSPLQRGENDPFRLFLVPCGGGSEKNLSVRALPLSSRPLMPQRPLHIPYSLRNYGETDSETDITLEINAHPVQTRTLAVPARGTLQGAFEYVPRQPGLLQGTLRITDPSLALDNQSYFTCGVRETIRVLLLETDTLSRVRPFHFLRRAVDPLPGKSVNGILTETAFVQELTAGMLARHHVVLLANPQPVSASAAALLESHMERGGTVIVFGGGQVEESTFAAFRNPALRKLYLSRERATAERSGMTFLGSLEELNDLLQLNWIRWQRLNALAPPPEAKRLAVTGDLPLIVQLPVGAGSLIACAFSIRRDSGNWPERKSFPISLIHLLTVAAQDAPCRAEVTCGTPVRFRTEDADLARLTLACHDGARHEIPVGKEEALFTETWRPGIVTADQAIPRAVAVNGVPEESVLAQMPLSDLNRISAEKTVVLKPDEALDSQIRSARQGHDLSGMLFSLTLLGLLAEMRITSPRARAAGA